MSLLRQFSTIRFQATGETKRATISVVAYVVILGVMLSWVPPQLDLVSGNVVTLFYLAMFTVTLAFVRRRGGLAAVGITRHPWVVGAALGVLIGGLGLPGTVSSFSGGTFSVSGR